MKHLLIITVLLIAVTASAQDTTFCYPSFTVTGTDTAWIGMDGFIETDSTAFDRAAYDHWYQVFTQYNDKTNSFKIVKDLAVIAEYQDRSRPTMTDLNDYPRIICDYLFSVDYNVRVNWSNFNIYNQE